jgi:hypothetical protein
MPIGARQSDRPADPTYQDSARDEARTSTSPESRQPYDPDDKRLLSLARDVKRTVPYHTNVASPNHARITSSNCRVETAFRLLDTPMYAPWLSTARYRRRRQESGSVKSRTDADRHPPRVFASAMILRIFVSADILYRLGRATSWI